MTNQTAALENVQPESRATGIIDPEFRVFDESRPLSPQLALDGLRSLAVGLKDHQMPIFEDGEFADMTYRLFIDNAANSETESQSGRYNFAARISATVGDLAIASVRGRAPSFALPYFREQTSRLLAKDAENTSLVAKQAAMVIAHTRIDGVVNLVAETAPWSTRLAIANARLRSRKQPTVVLSPTTLLTRSSARDAFLGLAISSIDELSGTLE